MTLFPALAWSFQAVDTQIANSCQALPALIGNVSPALAFILTYNAAPSRNRPPLPAIGTGNVAVIVFNHGGQAKQCDCLIMPGHLTHVVRYKNTFHLWPPRAYETASCAPSKVPVLTSSVKPKSAPTSPTPTPARFGQSD
jgi:hypothetical protein